MAYEPRDGDGALFPNAKDGNDKRPDWRGDVMIDGTKYRLSGWVKSSARGEFISLRAEPDQAREEAPRQQRSAPPDTRPRPKDEAYRAGSPAPRRQPSQTFEDDSDIPF